MLKTLIETLQADNYYGVDPLIDFAKGSYKAPESIKEGRELIKRTYYGKRG
jgi:hypothetical protein